MDVEQLVELYAKPIATSCVTSRMARVPLEIDHARFLGYPVRSTTFRSSTKTTKIGFYVGPYGGHRFIKDQRSTAMYAAARTLVRRVLSESSLHFVATTQE